MSTERDDLEKKKKEQARKERNKNLMKAGMVVLGAIGLVLGRKKG